MTKEQNQKIEELFQKAFKALEDKLANPDKDSNPGDLLDQITDIYLEKQFKEWEKNQR